MGSRRDVLAVSIIAGVISFGGLLTLEYFKDQTFPWFYAAGTNVLAVILGLAVVSLLWEYFVRKSHGQDLRHYLRLGASVAQSGLQEVTTWSALDWSDLLKGAAEVTALTDNAEWLERNQYPLLDLARKRVLSVTVAVPSRDGTYLARLAAVRGITADNLADAIEAAAEKSTQLWREAGQSGGGVRPGGKFSVVEHPLDLNYQVFTIDGKTIVTLSAPGDDLGLQDRLAFVYEQGPGENPTSFLRAHLQKLGSMVRLREFQA
jgi:hypothetical protein